MRQEMMGFCRKNEPEYGTNNERCSVQTNVKNKSEVELRVRPNFDAKINRRPRCFDALTLLHSLALQHNLRYIVCVRCVMYMTPIVKRPLQMHDDTSDHVDHCDARLVCRCRHRGFNGARLHSLSCPVAQWRHMGVPASVSWCSLLGGARFLGPRRRGGGG